MICVGDIHGDLNQLIYPLLYFLENQNECEKIIFIGDYTSRGFNDIYIYEIIRKLMVHENVIFLAGNHDVQAYYSPNLNAEMSSFFDFKFKTIGLKEYYLWNNDSNDESNNMPILFTHCKCNIPIDNINKITYDNIRLDRLYDRKKPPENSYFNIYGHEHRYCGDEHNFCVDEDSSFIYDVTKHGTKIENSVTKVSFSIIKNKNSIVHKTDQIQFGKENDFNSKPFSFLANLLNNKFGYDHDFNLNDSFETFKSEYLKSFKDPTFKNVFSNFKKIWKCTDTWGTYGNVPYEFYHNLGLLDSQYKNIIEIRNMIKNSP